MKKEQGTVHTSTLVLLMAELKADGRMGFNPERNGFSPSPGATDLEVIAFKIWLTHTGPLLGTSSPTVPESSRTFVLLAEGVFEPPMCTFLANSSLSSFFHSTSCGHFVPFPEEADYFNMTRRRCPHVHMNSEGTLIGAQGGNQQRRPLLALFHLAENNKGNELTKFSCAIF